MKKCFKCSIIKPLTDFYKHKGMRDGHLNKCKECTKRDVCLDRKNSPNAREYDKKRWKEDKERYKKHQIRMRKYRKENPEKCKAHALLNSAIRAKKIMRQNCMICGNKAHAHHDDYSKPFEVTWLCSVHHGRMHQQQAMENINA